MDDGHGNLWKLMTGDEEQYAWTGEHYPNATTTFNSQDPAYTRHCGDGCLFNVAVDPLEESDVAADHADIVKRMRTTLEAHERTAFNPHRGHTDPGACAAALDVHGGFWGPWIGLA